MRLDADVYVQAQMLYSELLQRNSNGGSFLDAWRYPDGNRPFSPSPTFPVTAQAGERESASPAITCGTVLVNGNIQGVTPTTGSFIRI